MVNKEKQMLQERAAEYGISSLTDTELFKIIGYKGDNFYESKQFVAMKEAVRRKKIQEIVKITKSTDIVEHASFMQELDHEQFWVMFLSRANAIKKFCMLSKGCIHGTLVEIREIVTQTCITKASSVILVHNHPSGNDKPSQQDIDITRKIKEALKFVDAQLIDHVIIAKDKHYSFADEGMM